MSLERKLSSHDDHEKSSMSDMKYGASTFLDHDEESTEIVKGLNKRNGIIGQDAFVKN